MKLRSVQRGMTLIELLVSLVIGLLIILAAAGALLAVRQGYTSSDAGTQLRENARFGSDLIQRIVEQAGYEDVTKGVGVKENATVFGTSDPEPDVVGFDNSLAAVNPTTSVDNSRPGNCPGGSKTECLNGSDVLIVRYYGASGWGTNAANGDGSIINCLGEAENEQTPSAGAGGGNDNRGISAFHVALGADGEPTLMCSRFNKTSGWQAAQPIVPGVEDFQVLYGIDTAAGTSSDPYDDVPNRYVRASDLNGAGNAAAVRAAWRRVRTVKIGMVLRSNAAVAAEAASTATTYFPFGRTNPNFVQSADTGSSLAVTTADGRVRQTVSFTVQLRNRTRLN